VNDLVSKAFDYFSRFLKMTVFSARTATLSGKSEAKQGVPEGWLDAVDEIADCIERNQSVVVSAHTGTGKTKFVPPLLQEKFPENRICVVMPRRVLCEEFARYDGVTWIRRGVTCKQGLMTCTYGYLNMLHASGNMDSYNDVIWVLDEGHEVAPEIVMLFNTMFATRHCVLLTATPTKWMTERKGWHMIQAAVPPLHAIVDRERYDLSVDDAIQEALAGEFKRILVVIPSARKVQDMAKRYKDYGFTAMWSENRSVPESGHVFATSIADAGLTLPGCDLVIDSGLRVVNDAGKTITVAVDRATSLQRRGRTGRTNPGEYWLLTPVKNKDYKPSPDIVSVLSESPMAQYFGTKVDLVRCCPPQVVGDAYGRCMPVPKKLLPSYSFFSKLVHLTKTQSEAVSKYKQAQRGFAFRDENIDYLLDLCGVEHLEPIETVYEIWKVNPVVYIQDSDDENSRAQPDLVIRENVLGLA